MGREGQREIGTINHRIRKLCWPVALFLAGCGYHVGYGKLYAYRSIRLDIFNAYPERRTHEFDFTQIVARELLDQGFRVNASDATHVLVGEITRFDEPLGTTDALDNPLVGSVLISLRIHLVDRKTGERVEGSLEETTAGATFTAQRVESLETARQQVFDRLARWVVQQLEVKKW